MAAPADTRNLSESLSEFLQEDNGGFSATRLGYLIWVVGVLAVWVFTSLKAGALQPLPAEVVTVLGILMSGKVVQKFGEAKVPPDPNP